ncbi:MAG: DUF1501 domain-containing protein [Acidobacteria bacterium]|nr:DUF1501 domain-containing protein [Acidobacteriota bacterium]MCI0721515.1 DUF1501 domain-containing protein [Acidobacteriota bacterium]
MQQPITRREALQLIGCGFGTLGLANMLHAGPARIGASQAPHFLPKARHVIFLFLNGGMSHLDTFDPKPELQRRSGQPMPGPKIITDERRVAGNLMASPYNFNKYGQSGIEVSEIFPKVGQVIDEFCVIRSTYADTSLHGPGVLFMNCGHQLPGRPSMGSWITYGLGSENENLPGFVVLCPGYPIGGPQAWSSAFLPNSYQGTHLPTNETDPEKLIQYIRNSRLTLDQQQHQLELLDKLDRSYLQHVGYQPQLEANIRSMEVAYRMQTEAPQVFDITKESEATRARYGDGDFGRGCLMALRMVEHGVRMVQIYFGKRQPWDSHDDIRIHGGLAKQADGPIAALVQDLKSRGLLDKTLVIVGSEFGRTPFNQNTGVTVAGVGRDHNEKGFTTLLAGGGVKRGVVYGATDEFGCKAVENPVHVHDLHATILHLLGLDHTRVTYRYSGRDFRLTDVAGNVVKDILA